MHGFSATVFGLSRVPSADTAVEIRNAKIDTKIDGRWRFSNGFNYTDRLHFMEAQNVRRSWHSLPIIKKIYAPDPAVQDELVELLYNLLTQTDDSITECDRGVVPSHSICVDESK
jgi:hypothetical protein